MNDSNSTRANSARNAREIAQDMSGPERELLITEFSDRLGLVVRKA